MELNAGTYCFPCDVMPWIEIALGIPEIDVSIYLTDEDIRSIVEMMHWAWDNEWFEKSISETVYTELLMCRIPQLYERIQPLVHQQFISQYPIGKDEEGYGVYEIFIPDIIEEYAEDTYKLKDF